MMDMGIPLERAELALCETGNVGVEVCFLTWDLKHLTAYMSYRRNAQHAVLSCRDPTHDPILCTGICSSGVVWCLQMADRVLCELIWALLGVCRLQQSGCTRCQSTYWKNIWAAILTRQLLMWTLGRSPASVLLDESPCRSLPQKHPAYTTFDGRTVNLACVCCTRLQHVPCNMSFQLNIHRPCMKQGYL